MSSHPFWNMKIELCLANKIDIILHGIETIGSAERSCDTEGMARNFMTISEGKYAKLLFHQFGEDRVLTELNDYLSLEMFPRFGGGIGITRFVRALRLNAAGG